MTQSSFDTIVIGAGPAGEVAAGRLADAGLEVAICEPHLIGGECSFYACMPSKALLVGEVPIGRLWQAVPSFPTRSEVWLDLFEEYGL